MNHETLYESDDHKEFQFFMNTCSVAFKRDMAINIGSIHGVEIIETPSTRTAKVHMIKGQIYNVHPSVIETLRPILAARRLTNEDFPEGEIPTGFYNIKKVYSDFRSINYGMNSDMRRFKFLSDPVNNRYMHVLYALQEYFKDLL